MTTVEVLKCSEGFYRENNSIACQPSCHAWKLYKREVSIFIDVVVFISAVIGFLAAVAVISISCLVHKRM